MTNEPFPQRDTVYFSPEFLKIRKQMEEKAAKKRSKIDQRRKKALQGSIIDLKYSK